MKLYYSPASPFVRKVMACAVELGIADWIEPLACAVHVIRRDQEVVAHNPLGQVPTLIAADGTAIFDSRVACEYLDFLVGGGRLFPPAGPGRWRALTEQSLADGVLDAAILGRQELTVRPPDKAWEPWREAQMAKMTAALDRMEEAAASFAGRVDIGTIATGCALGYLDFRYPDFEWRGSRPALAGWFETFAARPALALTKPRAVA